MLTMRLLLVCLLLAGCAAERAETPAEPVPPAPDSLDASPEVGPFENEDDYREQRAETGAALDAAISPATASDVSACRVVPTSEQACGGPTTFAVYSAESPDAAEAERLAARLVALDSAANAQFEYASTCMAYTPPTPVLRGGECVAE